ncbi:L-rhamnose/proton symporter RhaT [bacterium]|nr:L-rhamnose/proton symporter RhaT [bacterium]
MGPANPFLGVTLHAIGGFAAGSFYIPFKKVRQWSWETYWLVGGVFSWIIAPWIIALLTIPNLWTVLSTSPAGSLLGCYGFGLLWGIGGLTFGLSMRYLGMSLGYALALGFCAAFGTLIPPLAGGTFGSLLESFSGWLTLSGVLLCLVGIGICGRAGISKEQELSEEAKRATIREFDFKKGVWVAIFCGIMSACMAFGIAVGKPIAELALAQGAETLWQNGPVFIVILAGGFTTNLLWCLYLHRINHSAGDYLEGSPGLLVVNYFFSALAGVTWYFQFMFYGMGTTQMGAFDFSSWSLHMAFIIIFSNIWGIFFKEWKGTSSRTHRLIAMGILVLILSTLLIGYGNSLAASPSPPERP